MEFVSNLFKRYLLQGHSEIPPVDNGHANEFVNSDSGGSSKVALTNQPAQSTLQDKEQYSANLVSTSESEDSSNMDGDIEERRHLIQEINRVRIELNNVKQKDTSLALQLQQKEEVYLKAEAEFQTKENALKMKLDDLVAECERNGKETEAETEMNDLSIQLNEQIGQIKRNEQEVEHLKNLISQCESSLSARNCEVEKLKQENEIVRKHVSALEAAYPDTVSKFERSKDIILGYVRNENTMKDALEQSNQRAIKFEERYETLKTHANNQLDRAFKDILVLKEQHNIESNKLATIIRRYDIKIGSMEQMLDQKVTECKALASLCDEMTGSAVLK